MRRSSQLTVLASSLVFLYALSACMSGTRACNEAVCASLVSKCMLLKSCECNLVDKKNCTCCRDCHRCLAKLYTECCSCVGMCPENDLKDNMYRTSSVEELSDPIPELFNVLTEEADPYLRWTTYTYPAHLDLLYFKPQGADLNPPPDIGSTEGHHMSHSGHNVIVDSSSSSMNCSVAYMTHCLSLDKCRLSCKSMGAARYRWFHEYGCCECIGSTCLDFGKGEALCLKCTATSNDDTDDDDAYGDTGDGGEDEYDDEGSDDEGDIEGEEGDIKGDSKGT